MLIGFPNSGEIDELDVDEIIKRANLSVNELSII